MNRFLLLPFICLFFVIQGAVSQSRHFSDVGEEEYIYAMEKILSGIMDKKVLREFLMELQYFWSNETTSELRTTILRTSDLIHQNKPKPVDYQNYLKTVMILTASNQSEESRNVWHAAIINLLGQPRASLRNVLKLFEHTQNMITDDIIFSSAAIEWRAEHSYFRFTFSDSLRADYTQTRISCHTRRDSISILNTSGTINLQSGIWNGKQGEIDWTQSGFPANMVNARFGNYHLNMTKSEFEIENVEFQNKFHFNYSLHGKINHKVTSISKPENSTYPRFVSYEQRYDIKSIFPNFDYEGGFSQQGAKLLGSGTDAYPAEIHVFRNNEIFITAKSLFFILRTDQIASNDAEITIKLDTGFIYHPGLTFKYLDSTKDLYLIREGEGLSNSSFFSTFHNMSIDAQMIKWNINKNEIDIRMIDGAADNYAFFESTSYFREEFYNRLQGMDAVNPLQGLLNFSRQIKKDKFTALSYANYLGMPESPVRQQIINLSFYGFVGYNVNSDTIEIRDRLRDYVLFRAGQKDYDVIRFKSVTPGHIPNAVFDLSNYDIALNGVSVVSISDNQNVSFFPKDDKLTLKKDRSFNFDGTISAGMINLYGNSFHFNYQDFRIDLEIIDSMSMKVESRESDFMGRPLLRNVESTVEKLSGYLEIDRNDNKSGKEFYPEYPRLTSKTDSYVYYDKENIHDGAYERETFYFQVEPFVMEGINKLSYKNVAFPGELHSGIFPNINETLVVREDYSLGFKIESPPEGYPIYNGKANFVAVIDLSNKGLKGAGTLKYIESESVSDDFTFLPTQTVGIAQQFTVNPQSTGTEFPDVKGHLSDINFLPNENRLIATSQETPFTMHEGENKFEGALSVRPTGLEGKGTLDMTKATLFAKKMDLRHHAVMADSADFNLISEPGTTEVNFKTNNLLAHIDFETRKGKFTSRDINNKVEFTENRYVSYINDFSWEIDENIIMLGSSGSVGNRFVSTLRRQDELEFLAPVAVYDVINRIINADEVKNIYTADANMFLNDGKVTIRKDAVMDPLDSVRIVLNDSIHWFYDARVSILGKKAYTASGKYDYLNGDDLTKTIYFNDIEVNKNIQTVAKGSILEREKFTFNTRFAYQGDVTLTAENPLLNFKGGAKMLQECSTLGPQEYVRFDAEIDPKNVLIPIGTNVQNYEYENIYKAIYLNRDSNLVYSSFFEDRLFHSDVPIMTSEGFLYFKDEILAFVLESALKMANPDTMGTVFRYNEDGCTVTADGIINLGLEMDHVKMASSGFGTHNRGTGEAKFLTLYGVDFMLDPRSVEIMVNTIRDTDIDKKGNPESVNTLKRLAEWIGLPEAQKAGRELTAIEKLKVIPPEYQYTMVFDSLTWEWNQDARSYFADGKATLLWMKNYPVNREVHVKGKISFSRAGNTLDLHVEAKPGLYFFFSYRPPGTMQTRSSLEDYNHNILGLKQEERIIKASGTIRQYNLIQAPDSRLNTVLKSFENKNVQEEEDFEEEE
ncbi:MAG: hypothetical protein FWH18_08265 [Marinilabiliaceae bacterium]|nr:hypothetical protein [Marinilabiliaceae bacterium]